ncbi:FAD-dependent monooxygenase fsr3 [Colletotrichum spinosum]|uniref:FAD-dependent monooxygenase fsr3 n=1 Tax=Colletotrichum spinosum TaxID=1347390 RepID=A0A4R8Q3T3_9PEZI|nr:FAD-dependent monooxygenase fsr3 [Colletotrichum spinosum]
MTSFEETPQAKLAVPAEQKSSTAPPIYRENTIVDGVLRHPPSGVKVVVVGGGISGLFTAVECWRKGHEVVVLEKAGQSSDHGDVFGIGPSGLSTLAKYPSMLEEYNTIGQAAQWRFLYENGTQIAPESEYEYNKEGVAKHAAYPLYIKSIIRRNQLAKMLADQCARFGIPIHFNVSVTAYEENEDLGFATAVADNGHRFTGDVVIAADGIGTKSHAVILGHPTRANGTGFVMYRAVVPSSLLVHHPNVRRVVSKEQKPNVSMFFGGPGGQHHVITTLPDVVCYITLVKDDGEASESWSNRATGAEILSRLAEPENIDPLVTDGYKAIATENVAVKWLLAMRNPQPKWVSKGGRIVQVGDSAHSFLPSSGNGANTALESAITIAECLHQGGKSGANVATRVYQLLRYQRATIIQHTGLRNRQQIILKPSEGMLHQGKWLWAHQPEVYARDNFAQARAHIEHGAAFENTNLPPGHKFEDWTMEDEIAKEQAGVYLQDLKTNGDWGLV